MKIGIIGGGNISETHAAAARAIPGVEVVAVYGENRERTARLAARIGAPADTDLDGFFGRQMDFVAIGTPSGSHAELGIAAARRGVHVLVEKPIEISTSKAAALIEAVETAGVKLGVIFQDRLCPDIVEMKRRVDEGQVGSPVLISGRVKWYRPPDYYARSRWRGTWALDGGGALMNQGIHTVDLMQWLFGPVTRVQAATATRLHAIEVEDTAAAVLEFASGALGTIEATTAAFPGYPRRVEVTGARGTLVLEHDRLTAVDLQATEPRTAPNVQPGTSASASSPVVADATAHRRVFEDFIRAVETGGRPACDGREGAQSVALVEAIYTSAREHRAVTL